MDESAFFLKRMNDHVQYLGKLKATLADKGNFQGSDHHSCVLGHWLDEEGPQQSSRYGDEARRVFDSLLKPHEQFHNASHHALECKTTGDSAGMEAAMTDMFKLSVTLVDRLMKLDELSRRK